MVSAKRFKFGFTLIELLIVIAIIGTLSAAIIVAINPAKRSAQARDAIRKTDITNINTALTVYGVERGIFPDPGPDLISESTEGDNWIPNLVPDYLKHIPTDPKQGSSSTSSSPPPPSSPAPSPALFQPTAPYYATFYYPWYKKPPVDTSWSYWQDLGNSPPNTWFSHYVPDSNPSAFDPASELYSSNDYNNFKWQMSKMAEAKLEVAISSWWGQGRKEDVAFAKIINDFMARPDNPYPNLRWALYYEKESINPGTNTSPNDPPLAELVSDLTYIKDNYASSPYFVKVGGKPVIFVYADVGDAPGTMTQRWKDANSALGNYFYIVLKVFGGFASDPNQPNSWHQYAPGVRSGQHGSYDFFVSPGFWLDNGSVETLIRNSSAFDTAVVNMVSANVTWKLIETWNEWGEGTSVEPGEQVRFNSSTGKDELDPSGYPFKNLYVDILASHLPSLEQGTGVVPPSSPPPSGSPPPTSSFFKYRYEVTADRKSYVLWAILENASDFQAMGGSQSKCTKTSPPADNSNFNYCVELSI